MSLNMMTKNYIPFQHELTPHPISDNIYPFKYWIRLFESLFYIL